MIFWYSFDSVVFNLYVNSWKKMNICRINLICSVNAIIMLNLVWSQIKGNRGRDYAICISLEANSNKNENWFPRILVANLNNWFLLYVWMTRWLGRRRFNYEIHRVHIFTDPSYDEDDSASKRIQEETLYSCFRLHNIDNCLNWYQSSCTNELNKNRWAR